MEGQTKAASEPTANRKAKDSVFTNLFSDKKYLLRLYKTLHPDDAEVTEDDLEYITLERILVNGLYNDLGFAVRGRLMILVEDQSTWTVNIIIRILLYIASTYQRYFKGTRQSLFSTKPVVMPEPEVYVLYTGNRKNVPEEITLSKEFFGGRETAIEIKVKVLTGSQDGSDIISQYVAFTKILDGQVAIHGRTREAVEETIRICCDQNVLKEYLDNRKKEVIDIMTSLYDQKEVWEDYAASLRREVSEEVREKVHEEDQRNAILGMHYEGVPMDTIARSLRVNVSYVQSVITSGGDVVLA